MEEERKIKFRCWDVEAKKMYPVAFPSWNGMVNTRDGDNTKPDLWLSQNGPEQQGILMQFTGLLDRHGKEIYEGDLLAISDDTTPTFEVHWHQEHARFGMKRLDQDLQDYLTDWSERAYTIVGNRYENPDLLSHSKEV